ncbi:hypothetical protein KI809_12870 [Geobacter pelophilus]|uniref:Ada DNA repair metal-binding domain-containing protein n=2 Tax=Geoanaerobacter pelophilus TaxID=60036 RepID=A0AAW4L4W0_9BACT|nr:hypothetical protein [Geoanaerobacter pelophilus]
MPNTAYGGVWGSIKSKSYHLASCRYVKKTGKNNRIKFDSAVTARDAGYKPCEVCRPPAPKLSATKSPKNGLTVLPDTTVP